MAVVDPTNLSTDILPVHVKNINLFRSNDAASKKGDPHVADEEGITQTPSTLMSVMVDFNLKQLVGANSSYGSILALREDLKNKMFTMVAIVTDADLATSIFSSPTTLYNYIDTPDSQLPNNLRISKVPFSDSLIFAQNQDDLNPLDAARGATTAMISVGDGNNTTEVPFRRKFDGFNVNVPYMVVFLVPYLKYEADEDSPGDEIFPGRIATELVIKNNEISRASYLYYKIPTEDQPQEVLWTGDVHKSSAPGFVGRWMTGDGSSLTMEPLTRKRVYNSKISDNRRMAQIERLSVDFGSLSQLKNLSAAAKRRLDVMKRIRENSYNYLSDVMYSKTDNNNLNITFAINYGSILLRNALYAPLYANYNQLLQSCTMLSIQLLRRRVKRPDEYNKLTGGDIPNRVMNDNLETPIGYPQQINVNTGPGILHYSLTDTEMDDITAGIYEYGVEVRVLDSSIQKLNTLLSDEYAGLIPASKSLEEFISEGNIKGNYSIATNRYSSQFLSNRAQWLTLRYTQIIQSYQAAIGFLFGSTYDDLLSTLMALFDPNTSGPGGPRMLKKLLDDMITNILYATKMSIPRTFAPNTGAHQHNAPPVGSTKRIFSVKQWFKKTYDADELLDYGFDYFSLTAPPAITPPQVLNLREINLSTWQAIMSNEASKTNNLQTSNIIQYVTPNYLKMPGTPSIDLNATTPSTNAKLQNAFYRLAATTLNANSPPNLSIGTIPALSNQATNKSSMEVATIQSQTSMMDYHGCAMTLQEQEPDNNPEYIFNVGIMNQQQFSEYPGPELDAEYPLSPGSDFIVGPQLPGSAPALEQPWLRDPGTTTSLSNMKATIVAHASNITNYLVQTDFFNGKPNPKGQTMHTVSGKTFLKSQDINLDEFIQTAQQQLATTTQITANSNASSLPDNAIPALAAGQGYGGGTIGTAAPYNPPPTIPTGPTEVEKAISPAELDFAVNGLKGKLNPVDLPVIAAKYGFIHRVEYLGGYRQQTEPGAVDLLIASPQWFPLTSGDMARIHAGAILICRLVKKQTILENFSALKGPMYNQYFVIKPDNVQSIMTATNPRTNPSVPIPAVPAVMMDSYTQDGMETGDYASSPDPEAPASTPLQFPNYDPETIDEKALISKEGITSHNLEHHHNYVIDENGNGYAKEMCHPQHPNVCHSHVIKNYQVLEGDSKNIDDVNGVASHKHTIQTENGDSTLGTTY